MLDLLATYWYAIAGSLLGVLWLAFLVRRLRSLEARRKFQKQAAVAVFVGIIGIVVIFAWGINSDAYDVARTHAKDAPEAVSRFGTITSISVRSFTLESDDARYSFAVEGNKSNGRVTLMLKKDPRWRVIQVVAEQ